MVTSLWMSDDVTNVCAPPRQTAAVAAVAWTAEVEGGRWRGAEGAGVTRPRSSREVAGGPGGRSLRAEIVVGRGGRSLPGGAWAAWVPGRRSGAASLRG